MKRTLSSSVLKKKAVAAEDDAANGTAEDLVEHEQEALSDTPSGLKPRLGGSGSAWKAGALSDAGQVLQAERAQVVDRILSGRHELRIDPAQIVDVVGTDRRDDWRDQEAFEKLKDSIARNGQDTPIHVWPADPNWRPDERQPENVEGVSFQLIVGRRRHAILEALGQPVRALLVPQSQRGSDEEQFEMLFMRFRENEERENLSAFERLVSIGEMFERLQEAKMDGKLSATEFAKRVGVHNSAVSRGRAVFAAKDEILHACKNVYELSHRDLEQVLMDLSGKASKLAKKKPKTTKKLTVRRKIGAKSLSLVGQGGRLSVAATGLTLTEDVLNGLGDVIAEYLEKHGSK
ncbi:ParB N-terminal domain-containing protein [Yoonia sp. GPGPB17]|uniref:ParB N-terminal domain-containing protein n=1 Tax=Yoonia sp. GPGPB17 TaxID=3026147 RepID=UPI0030C5606D